MTEATRIAAYRIDPLDLRLFAAIVDTGSITAGARVVALSLSAASGRVKALEDLVRTPLLVRSKSGALPTAAGRTMARHGARVLSELQALHAELARHATGLRATVRVAGNTSACAALPAWLGPFLASHSDLDVDLREWPSEEVLDALNRDAIDIGIVASHVDAAGLQARPWLDDPLVVLAPGRGKSPAGGISFVQWLDSPSIGLAPDRGLERFIAQQARRSGRVVTHRVRVATFGAAAQLVAAGVGSLILPERVAREVRPSGTRLLTLREPWAQRRLAICTTPVGAARPAVQALIGTLMEQAESMHHECRPGVKFRRVGFRFSDARSRIRALIAPARPICNGPIRFFGKDLKMSAKSDSSAIAAADDYSVACERFGATVSRWVVRWHGSFLKACATHSQALEYAERHRRLAA